MCVCVCVLCERVCVALTDVCHGFISLKINN